MLRYLILCFAAAGLLSSCEKKEEALVLPPPSGANHATVEMGGQYEWQVFFDFESGTAVHSSDPLAWDLSFEASTRGRHIFINGGKDVYIYNTHARDLSQVTNLPAGLGTSSLPWHYDAPCGLPDSTAIGDWYDQTGASKGEVYIVKCSPGVYQKMRIVSGSDSDYVFEWAALESNGTPNSVKLSKDTVYNYVYFSFTKGAVKPDPPRNTWDVVFTRFRPLVFDTRTQVSVPYPATGVLLNPYRTLGAADSTTPFADIGLQHAGALQYTNRRDVIGYDWKTIDFNASSPRYTVNRAKNYLLRTRNDQLYKLRFLDYYNNSGVQGSPLFEYLRLH